MNSIDRRLVGDPDGLVLNLVPPLQCSVGVGGG
jgi:hypothetical protein